MINQQLSRFATHENSAYPQLWRGCVGAWCPSLGYSGTILFDYSRTVNHCTLNESASVSWANVQGKICLGRNALNNVQSKTNSSVIVSTGAITISSYVNRFVPTGGVRAGPIAVIGTINELRDFQSPASNDRVALFYDEYGPQWRFFAVATDNTFIDISTNVGVSVNEWVHVAATASINETSIYINGRKRASGSGLSLKTINRRMDMLYVTEDGQGNGIYLADCFVYDRALSDRDIGLLAARPGIAFTPRTRARATPEQAATTTSTLTISNATLNLTGQSSSLILSRKLLASNGSLNLAGQTSSLSLSRSLSTAKADLNISGQSSLLQVARLLSASNGTIEFSGQSADLRLSRNLSVNNAALSLSGQSTTIYAARSLKVDHADVNLSGQAITLSAGKTLTVNNGELQFTGQQVNLTTQRNLTIVNADISLSGQSVSMGLTAQQNLTVSNASIGIQGQQVTLRLTKSLVVLPAEIQPSGQTAQLTVTRKLTVQNGEMDLAGQDAVVRRRFELGIGEGRVSFSGKGIGLLSSRKILATEGRVQFSGQAVQIYPTFQNPVQIFGGNLRLIDKTTGSLRFIQEITR